MDGAILYLNFVFGKVNICGENPTPRKYPDFRPTEIRLSLGFELATETALPADE